jgi:hypothetical protein
MHNPTRRNRNIGTKKQGHGQNNKLTISSPYGDLKSFYEKLTDYRKAKRLFSWMKNSCVHFNRIKMEK